MLLKKKRVIHVADAIDLRSSSKMDSAMYQQIMMHLDQVYVDHMKTKKSINTNDYTNIRENHVITAIHSGKMFAKKFFLILVPLF